MTRYWRAAVVLLFACLLSPGAGGVDDRLGLAAAVDDAPAGPQAPVADKPAGPKITALPTPNDALRLATADAAKIAAAGELDGFVDAAAFVRYVWIEDGEWETLQAVARAVNDISRNTVVVRPVPVKPDDKFLVARIDARDYAPQTSKRANDLREWLETWEELQFDPRFNLLLTADTLKFAAGIVGDGAKVWVRRPKWVSVPCEPYTLNGTLYNTRNVRSGSETAQVAVVDVRDVVVARISGAHLDQEAVSALVGLTGSQAPIVTSGYFLTRALAAIRDAGNSALFAELYGGLYYDFIGVRGTKDGNDLDTLLQDLGVGDVDRKVDFKKFFDLKRRSDQLIGIFRSEVTAGPRSVNLIPTLSGRLDGSVRIAAITNDLKRSSIDIAQHPVFNLLETKPDAHEVIFTRDNGSVGYALFNGAGTRQDEAPPDVAKDHTIPPPHHGRLQPAISCISCHEADGSDSWKPLRNDVRTLLTGAKIKGVNVFDDQGGRVAGRSQEDNVSRIAGLYFGNTEPFFVAGRTFWTQYVVRASGQWKDSKKGQLDVGQLSAERIVKLWRAYNYSLVDARQALRELGVDVGDDDALRVLGNLLPPDAAAAVGNVIPEDPRIAGLRAGLGITRTDWDLVYGFAAYRAARRLQALQGGEK